MALTKKDVNGAFNFTYPSSDVFLKERNYFVFEGVQDDLYIKTLKIGYKTLNFGRYALDIGAKFHLDVSAYYAKYLGKFNVVITYENNAGDDVTDTTAINANIYDCYDPFKELTPPICGEYWDNLHMLPPSRTLYPKTFEPYAPYALYAKKNFGWNGKGGISIDTADLSGEYIFTCGIFTRTGKFIGMHDIVIPAAQTDYNGREIVDVSFETRYGDARLAFFIGSCGSDKDGAAEVEGIGYKEHSDRVIRGSFYIDNITIEYDVWYYKMLAQSEVVSMAISPNFDAFPNNENLMNIKITSTDIKDVVVGGVAQKTITFYFELR